MNDLQTTEAQHGEAMQLSSAQVTEQVQLIQQVLRSVMKQDEHYGVIPGTNKPTLLKAGAEKLCLTFRLSPSYIVERIDHPSGHREYIITARLTHIPTGRVWGEGVGSCSTLEKKYRYRNEYKPTGRKVPREYWTDRDAGLLGGKGFTAKKDDAGVWMIYEAGGQTENADIAEAYNTVLKMAKKRALTDATLNACAASDIFTQDLDEHIDDSPKPEKVAPKKDISAAQAEFEKSKGITSEVNENPEFTAEQIAEADEAAKKKAEGERRKARVAKMPDDVIAYFRAKGFLVGKVIAILDENEDDVERIRAYMKDNPVESKQVGDLAEHLADERMPEVVQG